MGHCCHPFWVHTPNVVSFQGVVVFFSCVLGVCLLKLGETCRWAVVVGKLAFGDHLAADGQLVEGGLVPGTVGTTEGL